MAKKRGGFTLTEMMLTVGIMGFLSAVGAVIFTQSTRNTLVNQAKIDTQREARTALDIINRSIRQARASTISVSSEAGQPPYSSVSFTAVDDSSWKFYQSGKSLFSVSNGSTSTLCENLRYIAFTYARTDQSGIISVSITTEEKTYQSESKVLQLSVEQVRIMND